MNVNLNRIKSEMKARKITNAHIARETGVTQQWVSMVIHGHSKSPRIKKAIADRLEIPYNELWPETA